MLIKVQVTGRQVRAALAEHPKGIELGERDTVIIGNAETDVSDVENALGDDNLRRIAGEHCDRDHSAEDYDEDDMREALDPRSLGDFVHAVVAGDRVGAGALATRLFIDGELEAVETALRRMKVAA